MNLVELDQALRKLRLSGMADVLETRLLQAQTEQLAPLNLVAALVSDEPAPRRGSLVIASAERQPLPYAVHAGFLLITAQIAIGILEAVAGDLLIAPFDQPNPHGHARVTTPKHEIRGSDRRCWAMAQ